MSGVLDGPYFDELEIGQVFDRAPACTLTEGRAAAHQVIVGDRLRLALDEGLSARVLGGSLAHPGLVWNLAIGQSTLATRHVRANLFYRRLTLLRQPVIGDTLHTMTTVVGLRENSRREDRAPTGLAALHVRSIDQHDRPVLDFYRCAMLPLRGDGPTGHGDDLEVVGAGDHEAEVGRSVADWDLSAWWRSVSPGPVPEAGEVIEIRGGDVVSSAPELARLTLNIAEAHHDERSAGGRRLVYGGHTIALALAQAARALPDLMTVLAWRSCDHTGPVGEGDTLRSTLTVERVAALAGGGHAVDLRSVVTADGMRPVLDWRFTALFG